VAAGEPLLAQQHIEGHFQVDPAMFKPNADFCCALAACR
jgi:repressor LexA